MPTALEPIRGNQNAFDRLLNWIGALKVQGQDVGDFERDVLELERIVQLLDSKTLNRVLNRKLEYWLELILQSTDVRERVEDQDVEQSLTVIKFHEKIKTILTWLKEAQHHSKAIGAYVPVISGLQPSPNLSEYEKSRLSLDEMLSDSMPDYEERQRWLDRLMMSKRPSSDRNIEFYSREASHNANPFESTKATWINREEFKDHQYQWEVFVRFSGDHHRAAKVSKVIWLLSEALESVSGIVVEIEDQGTGSKWFKLKIFILNLIAKDEVKDLLEKSRDAVLAEQVDKRIEGAEKLKEEKLKIQTERSLLARQVELTPDSEEAKKIRELELRKKELEIREKEADVKRKELENYKATLDLTQQLAYMMKEGMFAAAPVEIKINGETYLSCQDGKFLGGATMGAIDQAGAVKPEDESI